MDISKLDLPPRANKFCRMACIETVEELIQLSPTQIRKFRALGKPSIPDFKRALEKYGLRLGMKSSAGYIKAAAELDAKAIAFKERAKLYRKLAATINKLG